MVDINEDALRRAIQPGLDDLEARANRQQQVILTETALRYAGRPADEVYEEIVRRCRAEIPGWEPIEENLRPIAEQIEDRKS